MEGISTSLILKVIRQQGDEDGKHQIGSLVRMGSRRIRPGILVLEDLVRSTSVAILEPAKASRESTPVVG